MQSIARRPRAWPGSYVGLISHTEEQSSTGVETCGLRDESTLASESSRHAARGYTITSASVADPLSLVKSCLPHGDKRPRSPKCGFRNFIDGTVRARRHHHPDSPFIICLQLRRDVVLNAPSPFPAAHVVPPGQKPHLP